MITPSYSKIEEKQIAVNDILGNRILPEAVRNWLVKELISAINLSKAKTEGHCRPKTDKIAWVRVIGYLSQVLGGLLKDAELQEINHRLKVIEDAINKKD